MARSTNFRRHGAPRLIESGDARRSPRASGVTRRGLFSGGWSAAFGLRRESPLSGAHRTPPIPTPPRPPRDSASPAKTPEDWRALQTSAVTALRVLWRAAMLAAVQEPPAWLDGVSLAAAGPPPLDCGENRRLRARTEPRQSQPRLGLPETPRPHPKPQRTGALYKLPQARRSASYRERRCSPQSKGLRLILFPRPPPIRPPDQEFWAYFPAPAMRPCSNDSLPPVVEPTHLPPLAFRGALLL